MRIAAMSTPVALLLFGCINEGSEDSSGGSSGTGAGAAAEKEVKEAVGAVKALAAEKVDEFRQTMQTKLASIDERIDAFKRKAKQASVEAREELTAQLQNLAEKRQAMQKELDALEAATDEAWADLTAGVNLAYRDLERAVGEAAGHFSDEKSGVEKNEPEQEG